MQSALLTCSHWNLELQKYENSHVVTFTFFSSFSSSLVFSVLMFCKYDRKLPIAGSWVSAYIVITGLYFTTVLHLDYSPGTHYSLYTTDYWTYTTDYCPVFSDYWLLMLYCNAITGEDQHSLGGTSPATTVQWRDQAKIDLSPSLQTSVLPSRGFLVDLMWQNLTWIPSPRGLQSGSPFPVCCLTSQRPYFFKVLSLKSTSKL